MCSDTEQFHTLTLITCSDTEQFHTLTLCHLENFTFRYSRQDNGRLALREEGNNFGGLPCSPDAAISLADETLVFKGESEVTFTICRQYLEKKKNKAKRKKDVISLASLDMSRTFTFFGIEMVVGQIFAFSVSLPSLYVVCQAVCLSLYVSVCLSVSVSLYVSVSF